MGKSLRKEVLKKRLKNAVINVRKSALGPSYTSSRLPTEVSPRTPLGYNNIDKNVQAPDGKFSQDLTHQKSLSPLIFDRVIKNVKRWTFWHIIHTKVT